MLSVNRLGCTHGGADGRKAFVAVGLAAVMFTGAMRHLGTGWRRKGDVSAAGPRLALAVDTMSDRGLWRVGGIDGNGAVPFRVLAMTRVCGGLAMWML